MKNHQHPLSATSVQRAPHDEASARIKQYALTMGIRTACFLAMAFIQPFGWYTWVLGAGAIFLPYLAVVRANTGSADDSNAAETPMRGLEMTAQQPLADDEPPVLRIAETPPKDSA